MQYVHLCGTLRMPDINKNWYRKYCAGMRIRVVYCSSLVFIVFRLLILITRPNNVDCFSDGIPISNCSPMESIHGVQPQNGNNPFFTYTDKRVVTNNDADAVQLMLTIKQRSIGDEMVFKGFLLMAFDDASNANNESIGSFFLPSDGQVISCSSRIYANNAVTHKSSEDKQFVTVYWKPPKGFVGSVTLRTTFLKNGTVFWINTPTDYSVQVVNASLFSTSTEYLPSEATTSANSDTTSDGNVIITTTETLVNTTEEVENSTDILTTTTEEATTKSITTNKPQNSAPSSKFLFDFHVLLVSQACWTVLFCMMSDKYILYA